MHRLPLAWAPRALLGLRNYTSVATDVVRLSRRAPSKHNAGLPRQWRRAATPPPGALRAIAPEGKRAD
eukprot:361570-Chlamydomonas_euryale.AAC.3